MVENIHECRKKLLEVMIKEQGSKVEIFCIPFKNNEAVSEFLRKQKIAKEDLQKSEIYITLPVYS